MSLYLNEYEYDSKIMYCWSIDDWSSQEFKSEKEALSACKNKELKFSKADYASPVETATINTIVNHDQYPPYNYWLIDGSFVVDPTSFVQLGELPEFEIQSDMSVMHITQDQFDQFFDEYYEENGHYPHN